MLAAELGRELRRGHAAVEDGQQHLFFLLEVRPDESEQVVGAAREAGHVGLGRPGERVELPDPALDDPVLPAHGRRERLASPGAPVDRRIEMRLLPGRVGRDVLAEETGDALHDRALFLRRSRREPADPLVHVAEVLLDAGVLAPERLRRAGLACRRGAGTGFWVRGGWPGAGREGKAQGREEGEEVLHAGPAASPVPAWCP
jgi:hypothetical protein